MVSWSWYTDRPTLRHRKFQCFSGICLQCNKYFVDGVRAVRNNGTHGSIDIWRHHTFVDDGSRFRNFRNDIAAVKKELEDWGRGIVLLFPDEKGYKNFDPKEFGDLPGTITYGLDIDGAIQKEMATAMKLQNANTLPIFLIADTFNRVVFVSQGYTIGLGEQLMKVIHKL